MPDVKLSHYALLTLMVTSVGCDENQAPETKQLPPPESGDAGDTDTDVREPLFINEIMSKNAGAWVDGVGETDDWVELYNGGDEAIDLGTYRIADRGSNPVPLADIVIPAGGTVVLFADDDIEQGPNHLPFKLSSDGDAVTLLSPDGTVVDEVTVPPLAPNDVYTRIPDGADAFVTCNFATPGRLNGDDCGPPPPPSVPDDVTFSAFTWQTPWPLPPTPLTLNEFRLFEAPFVELLNVSDGAADLDDFDLRIAPIAAGEPYPGPEAGASIPLPSTVLDSGAFIAVDVPDGLDGAVADTPWQEGVLTLFEKATERAVERVDFMHWPSGAALTRQPDGEGQRQFCNASTEGASNDRCDPVPSRELESHVRGLRTPGDFDALAAGGLGVGLRSVKAVVDLEADAQVYFLNSDQWLLHYNFVRDVIEGNPPLDLCDPDAKALFQEGRDQFDAVNYYQVEGRRYLLGTLSLHAASSLHTYEYNSAKDVISGPQMKTGFFATVRRVPDPTEWYLRPVLAQQLESALAVDGELPIVGMNGPFQNMTFQPLNTTVGYGVLTFVPARDLDDAALGAKVILLTDLVPNDIPLAAGVITESFQTPLSHVNVLSKNRGTPNMSLRDARNHPDVAPFIGKLVRLEVTGTGFDLTEADPEEASAFYESRKSNRPIQVPGLDDTVRGIVPLDTAGFESAPSIGAKAAQLAEIIGLETACAEPLETPRAPFAIPVSHYLDHFRESGAAALLTAYLDDAEFQSNPLVRDQGLEAVRAVIRAHPVDPALLEEVEQRIDDTYGAARVRFRSSSNTEDLEGFSGAGLYTSVSAALGDPDRRVEDAIRTVWASLWHSRAYEEREYYNVSQEHVAMGILCHEAFLSERANGVAISRDLTNPKFGARDYVNVQLGEASVTNPAPGITSDLFLYRDWREPSEDYHAMSSFLAGTPVLEEAEIDNLHCTLRAIQKHLRPFIDPEKSNDLFTMEIEFKLIGDARKLLVKQARPYTFGNVVLLPDDC